jgi:hypothetical protein
VTESTGCRIGPTLRIAGGNPKPGLTAPGFGAYDPA